MKKIESLLFFLDPRVINYKCIELGSWLSGIFQAHLHVVTPILSGYHFEDTIQKAITDHGLMHSVSFHEHGELSNFPPTSIIREFNPDLIIFNLIERSESRKDSFDGLVPSIVALLKDNIVPTLIVPEPYQGKTPWNSLMVSLSGERHTQAAFSFAIDICHQLGTKLHLIHVMDKNETNISESSLMSCISDVAHLELPMVLEEILFEGAPYSSSLDWQDLVEDFSLCQGDAVTEIKAIIEKNSPDLLIMQWRGTLLKGRALVLAGMIQEIPCPILIVRSPDQTPSVLGVDQHYSKNSNS